MFNFSHTLTQNLQLAFTDTYRICPPTNLLQVTPSKTHGYTTKNLLLIKRFLESQSISTNVENIYQVLITNLEPDMVYTQLVSNYLNIIPTSALLSDQIYNLVKMDNIYPQPEMIKKILVDFSSPNIAKDMHVGHLRSTIIGDSICNLFEAQGHQVLRVNHIGDFGLQFGMIIQYLLEFYPNYQHINLNISDLQTFYAQSKQQFDHDEEFQNQSYQRVVDLQTGNPEITQAWNWIKQISAVAYNQIYDRLGIKLTEVGESFYQHLIPDVITELTTKGLVEMVEGRQIIRVDGFEVPLTIVKSDGGWTYDTTDLTALHYRLVTLNQDEIYYVVDSGQSLHFDLVFKVAELAGWLQPHQKVNHVQFGVVLGSDGKKFRSRDGNTIKLVDLLDEGVAKAHLVLKSNAELKDPEDIINSVAYGSIKYADLSNDRTSTYLYSPDKMLSFKGNTGVYQLYEYVRIVGILRKCQPFLADLFQYRLDMEFVQQSVIKLTEPSEIELCQCLLMFPEMIQQISGNLMFNLLCNYLYNLTQKFSSFHTKCRCLEFNDQQVISINYSRVLICLATQKIMKNCFDILGLKAIEYM